MLSGIVDSALLHRERLPRLANRAIDYIADHPMSPLGRLAARRMGRVDPKDIPAVSIVDSKRIRVLIAPVNYSGQGRLWATSLERFGHETVARNMAIDIPGGFSFPADLVVPVPAYHNSREWQLAQLAAVHGFTHVLIEAEEPLFGRLFDRDVGREVTALTEDGIAVAFMCHGTDIRLPSRHRDSTPWSPYRDPRVYVARLERLATVHRALLDRFDLPVFVSTPDLLWDVPRATWCPVVVDPQAWATPKARPDARRPLRVVHAPTSAVIKGTDLVDPTLARLHDRRIIDYRPLVGVPSSDMRRIYREADVVLDQFRLGSYGVTACEAMAAGRMVIGHVLDDVRQTVVRATGLELPVVEATPDTIEDVLVDVATNRARLDDARATGTSFVTDVHDGRLSAKVLRDRWIEPSKPERG